MDVSEIVTRHYGSRDLTGAILGALADHGVDVDHLTAADLAPVDQLHAGFVAATEHVLDTLAVGPDTRLLDVGSGVGGPARLAATRGARVTGADLTPRFVDAATALTARAGLSHRVSFVVSPGDAMPFPDAEFDAAMMIHVGMNVPDKHALFAEVRRVLVPGARFAIYDQMRAGEGELPWPLPWADDERSSFVESADAYSAALADAGFEVEQVEDRTAAISGPPPPGLTNATVMGPDFMQRIGNTVAAAKDGLLTAVQVLARAA